MENDYCFIVEIESGSTDHGSAFVFDSVWNDEDLAKEYCRKRYQEWNYTIEKQYFNIPG